MDVSNAAFKLLRKIVFQRFERSECILNVNITCLFTRQIPQGAFKEAVICLRTGAGDKLEQQQRHICDAASTLPPPRLLDK